ncbi:MAG: serine/threonine protein phosphatase [Ignavibacteria bacterium]|nr:serine/threonine protein phosphatase [Ignavibacteria bacterium]
MKKESRVAVIGDIHGCYYTLLNLFERIKDECSQVFTVGDLIDRGHYSKEVVQFCIDNNIMSVRGNHEDMLINAIGNSGNISAKRQQDIDLYFYNGGDKTQKSYINSRYKKDFDILKRELQSNGHLKWIKSLPLKYESKVLVISHAGIIECGDEHTILWNRDIPTRLNKLQIFGHTHLDEVDYVEEYFVNIDTACVYGNKLSALILEKSTAKIIDIVQEELNSQDKLLK